jgi:hypothetical protein
MDFLRNCGAGAQDRWSRGPLSHLDQTQSVPSVKNQMWASKILMMQPIRPRPLGHMLARFLFWLVRLVRLFLAGGGGGWCCGAGVL